MQIKTDSYKNIINEVIVDDREGKRIDYALKQYDIFNPHKKHLDIGDYIFISPKGIKTVFEYKAGNDFLTSIDDNRLYNQYYDLVTNFDYAFIIVECEDLQGALNERYYETGLDMCINQVNGSIADLTMNCTVLFAQTQYQAFDLMMRVSGKIFINKPLRYKYGKKTRNSALNYLTSIRGIGSKAEIIVDAYDLHSLNDLMTLTPEMLMEIKGVGKNMTKRIMEALK